MVTLARQAPVTARVALPDRPLPSWPVDALLWGFPLWWVLGMTPFITALMATVMVALLLARRRVGLVPGIAPWLAFVAWVLPCGLMIDTVPRLAGYAQRFATLVAVAVVIVYVVNARERLPLRRLLGGLAAVWVTVVLGGYLGVLFPEGRLTTPVGVLLPGWLTRNELVYDLVFPPFAEVQQPWGAPEPFNRPSAPFPYANSWGSAVALLVPVVVGTLLMREFPRRVKPLLLVSLVAAAVPAMASLNRGMLIGLAAAVGYVCVRLLLRGAVMPLAGLTAVAAAGAYALVAFDVVAGIAERTQYSSTNQGRAAIYAETFQRTLESPLLGYGAPRPSEVLDISAGTQGHVWMLMFSYGFVGLGLFLWFLYGSVLRTWRAPGAGGLWLHATLVVSCVLILFYGLGETQLLIVALVAAVLLRERAAADGGVRSHAF